MSLAVSSSTKMFCDNFNVLTFSLLSFYLKSQLKQQSPGVFFGVLSFCVVFPLFFPVTFSLLELFRLLLLHGVFGGDTSNTCSSSLSF